MQYFSRLIVTAAILLSPLMASGDTEIIKAQGQGVASTTDRSSTQAKLMSLRAARIDAQNVRQNHPKAPKREARDVRNASSK